jgi:inhibitor of KinA sporulation pathway (predicted exonuclease)
MKTCINFDELIQIHQPQIEEMQRVGNSFADPRTQEACKAFTEQVRLVEGAIRQTYREAVALARRAADAAELAEIWQRMGGFCRAALQALAALKDRYPDCGAPELYDLALDYKNACDERHAEVMEEIACQGRSFPPGLFPERI